MEDSQKPASPSSYSTYEGLKRYIMNIEKSFEEKDLSSYSTYEGLKHYSVSYHGKDPAEFIFYL